MVDHGVSGVTTALRTGPRSGLFDMLRAGDTLVVRWVDRLGRNYADVTDAIREFIRRGAIVRTVINGLTFKMKHRNLIYKMCGFHQKLN